MVGQGWGRIRSLGAPMRVLAFLGLILISWFPLALILWGLFPQWKDFLWIPLYVELFVWLWIWGRQVRGQVHPYADYGLARSLPVWPELWVSCIWGLSGLLLFFMIEGGLGWLRWQPISGSLLGQTLIVGLGLGLGVAWVEELLFRGWLAAELQDDYGSQAAAGWSSLIFAIAHFLKPWQEILRTWPQFPGLLLMGWILLYARRHAPGQLGSAVGLHAGWIWGITLINTLDWVNYTGRVPEWITGVDGNPLAGVIGLLFLSFNGLSLWLYSYLRTSRSHRSQHD